MPDAIRAVQTRRPLEVRNPASTRPWQHVLDPLGGYLLLGTKLLDDPLRYGEAFNLGPNPNGMATVGTLVERLYGELGRGRYVDLSKRQKGAVHEARLLHLSCEKAQKQLNWRPIFEMGEAIERTAAWYRDVLFGGVDARVACCRDIAAYAHAWVAAYTNDGGKTVRRRKTGKKQESK